MSFLESKTALNTLCLGISMFGGQNCVLLSHLIPLLQKNAALVVQEVRVVGEHLGDAERAAGVVLVVAAEAEVEVVLVVTVDEVDLEAADEDSTVVVAVAVGVDSGAHSDLYNSDIIRACTRAL
jgi:hypothetical protein